MSPKKMVKETTYDIINEGIENGYLSKLVNSGLISYTPIAHKEIYEMVLKEREMLKKEGWENVNTQSVHNVSVNRGISSKNVWEILKKMEMSL